MTALLVGSDVLSIVPHAKARVCHNWSRIHYRVDSNWDNVLWSTGLRVDVEVNGEEKGDFFKASTWKALLKAVFRVMNHINWNGMARAEYESQKALAAVIPDNVVIPMAWGIFEDDMSKAFFMTGSRN